MGVPGVTSLSPQARGVTPTGTSTSGGRAFRHPGPPPQTFIPAGSRKLPKSEVEGWAATGVLTKQKLQRRSENRKRNTLKERVFLPGKIRNPGQGPDPQIIIVTHGLGRRGRMLAGLSHTLLGLMIFTFLFF